MGATAIAHPTDQVLQSFALGKLDDDLSETVRNHLMSCNSCQRRVADLSPDDFVGRLQKDQVDLDKSSTGWSPSASSSTDGARHSVGPPPRAHTLPPGLADHRDYEVIRELGHGGMGTVYLAENRLMGRREVLKVVSSHLMKRSGVLERFLGEIRNAARLHHTNIVTAYSASRLGESIIFAMEYVDGLDLARLVKANGPLPVAHACNYAQQAALGLAHAHERGMVHRDIKPSNLMLAGQGSRPIIKVLDFGLAKIKSEGPRESGLTHEGQMLGTPDYIAPEQIRDARGADIRADVYSLGCTLYYLLTGRPPFQATSLYELLQAHHSIDALPLNLVRPDVPVELAALVAKMMAKERKRRFQEPAEVARALKPFFKKAETAHPTTSYTGSPALAGTDFVASVARAGLATFADADRVLPHVAQTLPLKSQPESRPAKSTAIERADNDNRSDDVAEPAARMHPVWTRPPVPVALGLVLLAAALGAVAVVAFIARLDRKLPGVAARDLEKAAIRSSLESVVSKPSSQTIAPRPLEIDVAKSPTALKPPLAFPPARAYIDRIQAAQTAARAHNWNMAVQELDECPAAGRGWEWGYLRRLCDRHIDLTDPTGSSVSGTERFAGTLSFSPDGRKIAAGSVDRTVKVWDTSTSNLQILQGDGAVICGVAFSPVAMKVAAATTEGVRIWDVNTGRLINEFRDHADCANTLAFSPDGTLLASGGDDKTVRIRDLARSKLVRTLEQPVVVPDVIFSRDGTRIASAGEDGIVRLWDVADGRLLRSLVHDTGGGAVAFNDDGTRIATGSASAITLWDVRNGQKLFGCDGSGGRSDELEISPDGKRIAAAMQDRTIRIWDASTGRLLLTIDSPVLYNNVAFSPDGRRLAASGRDQPVLTVWDSTWPESK